VLLSVDRSVLWFAVDQHADDVRIDKALSVSLSYWLQISLHDIDDLFIGHHWEIINSIVPVYDRFVHNGTCLNRTLKEEFEVSCDWHLLIIMTVYCLCFTMCMF